MSAKEMEKLDEQVLQVANRAGEDRSANESAQAEQAAENQKKIRNVQLSEEQKRKEEKLIARAKMKDWLKMLAKVAACLVAAGVFLALLLDPEKWAPVVGCLGIMTFVVVGAICIDRYAQRMKRWR